MKLKASKKLLSDAEIENLRELKPFYLELCKHQKLSSKLEQFQKSEDLSIGVFILSAEGYFVDASYGLCEILGYGSEEIRNIQIQSLIYSEDINFFQAAIKRLITGQTSQENLRHTFTTKDQQPVNLALSLFLLNEKLYADTPNNLIAKFEDRTIGDRLERKIRTSEQFCNRLFEDCTNPILIFDSQNLEIKAANNAAIYHYGYSREELLNQVISHISTDINISILTPVYGFSQHLKKNGQVMDVEVSCHSLLFNGSPAQILCSRDITEEKRTKKALEALRQAEEDYRSIFENAVEGIFQTSEAGQYLKVNPMLATIYGYDSAEDLMNSITDIGNQLYVQPDRRIEFANLLKSQDAVLGFESEIYRKDGTIVWISENVRAIRDPSGKLLRYEGTVEDFTEIKRAQDELKLLQNLSLAISTAEDFHSAIAIALQQICETTGWEFGEVWVPVYDPRTADQDNILECCNVWFSNDPTLAEFRNYSLGVKMHWGEGLPGRVWSLREPEWLQDISQNHRFIRKQIAHELGINSAFGVPILAPSSTAHGESEEVVAVMVFLMRQTCATNSRLCGSDQNLIDLVTTVARQLGSVIQRKYSEEALRLSEERFRLTFNYAPIGMMIKALDGRSLQVNQAICAILGYTHAELLELTCLDITHPEDLANSLEMRVRLLHGEFPSYQISKRYIRKDRKIVEAMLHVSLTRDANGEPIHFIDQIEDVSDRNLAEAKIAYLAFHDPLTGLPNRALFNDRLTQALSLAARQQESELESLLAVMFIDLDRFKCINDSLGHAMGDRLLQLVAERLTNIVRKSDTIARMGGDEFMLLLPKVKQVEDVVIVAEKILKSLADSFHLDHHQMYITASIGICFYPHDGDTGETLLKNADVAMYRAKEQGRNHYQIFTQSMHNRAFEWMSMESGMRRAIAQAEFEVYYQPQLDLQSGRVICMEALIRWPSEYGFISPDQFIPIAEEYGLIIPIGEWVLRTACTQNKLWQNAGLSPIQVSVNFSAKQFQDPQLLLKVCRIIEESKLAPHYLEIEITESAMMKDENSAAETLVKLKNMGINISIDDFGKGYSSLSHLKKFPVQKLKIDASFIKEIPHNKDDEAISTAIIAIAHTLNLKAIAEGVETTEQLEFLRSLRCDGIQGYIFSPAVTAEAATKILHDQRHFLSTLNWH